MWIDNPQSTRFVLTGSQHFGLSEAVSQSLAGRVGVLYLLPPGLDELARFAAPPRELLDVLWTGAYPRIHDRRIPPDVWLRDYFATYVERDVRSLRNVTDSGPSRRSCEWPQGAPRWRSACPPWQATSESDTTPFGPGCPSWRPAF